MELVSIGEAARRFGVRTSTLRYYEDRDLLWPATRVRGTRMYGREELRRLAFLQVARRLGIPLDAAGAVLDKSGAQWRVTVADQVTELEELIARAKGAKSFLIHAQRCPEEHPASECPYMVGTLDRLIDGTSFEQIAQEHREGG